jgi:hypothetical protein
MDDDLAERHKAYRLPELVIINDDELRLINMMRAYSEAMFVTSKDIEKRP